MNPIAIVINVCFVRFDFFFARDVNKIEKYERSTTIDKKTELRIEN